MAGTVKHTPTPWRVDPAENCDIQADGLEIASTHPMVLTSGVKPEGLAPKHNAAFIVLAVNSHDALIEALRESIKQLDTIIADGTPTDWQSWRDDLGAAIAKAEGQS